MTRPAARAAARRDRLLPGRRDARIADALLRWYAVERRDLPWRRTRDPYAIWVSEAMLQQTQVATVRGYYERWMNRFPTLRSLAASSERDVLHAWQGLGYYSRAKNLRRAALLVVERHGGQLPHTAEALRTLPGVGPYSAGAVASIAHGERVPLVDGNVVRVLCRLFRLRGDPTRAPLKGRLWDLADALVPASAPGDFNQALMELGATVCVPRAPDCRRCPLTRLCDGRRAGVEQKLPELPRRRATIAVSRAAAVVCHGGEVFLEKVPEEARRWTGFWKFPNTDVCPGETPERAALRAAQTATRAALPRPEKVLTVRHSVTHHRITLEVFRFDVASKSRRKADSTWRTPRDLESLPLPAPDRKIARRLRERVT